MKAINRNQAMEIYNNLSDLAHALAESFGSTIETCKDPICIRFRKFSGVDELREDDLLIVDENETPMFFLDEYHMDKTWAFRFHPQSVNHLRALHRRH